MNQILLFLLYYAAVLLLGAVVITGWFTITRGEWYKNPDDTPYWSGKLFSPWLRFWSQEKEKADEIYYYNGLELETIAMQITDLLGIKHYQLNEERSYLIVNDTALEVLLRKRHYVFYHLKVIISEMPQPNERNRIFLYRTYPTYKFPEWVRSPLATCIYCFGSIYGSLVWWVSAYVFKTCFDFPVHWSVIAIFWVPFIISQSFVAPYLNKKL